MSLPTPTTANAPGEATTGGRAAFLTYGCRLNQYDTQGIRQAILELGYTEVDGDRDLDLIVVNSCTVTARAGERVESRVRTLSKIYYFLLNQHRIFMINSSNTIKDGSSDTFIFLNKNS